MGPYRQWVVTFPFALRLWLAANNRLLSQINKIATCEIGKFYCSRANAEGVAAPLAGAITFIQRSGSALNSALHLHILTIDGVYWAPAAAGVAPRLHATCGPSDEDVGMVVENIATRTVRLLRRKGYRSCCHLRSCSKKLVPWRLLHAPISNFIRASFPHTASGAIWWC